VSRPGACARCGRAAAAGQEYCLGCGLAVAREEERRRRTSTRAGGRALSLMILLVVGAVGALAAVAVGRDDGTATIVATRVHRVAPPVRTRSLPELEPATVPASPPTLPTTTRPASSALTAWTLADGYTVVLVSIPRAGGRARAEAEARLALAKGLRQVGVLDSNEFTGLARGYFVVFSGVFRSGTAASAQLARAAAAGFRSAYERHIVR
jgi:hypothetical protein